MAKKTAVSTLTLETMQLQYVREVFGAKSPIFDANKSRKSVTLTGWRAEAVSQFLVEKPMPADFGTVVELPMATSVTHEIKRKEGAAVNTGWTWLSFNGRVSKESFDALRAAGFNHSKKRSVKGLNVFYAQTEIAEKAARKIVKL